MKKNVAISTVPRTQLEKIAMSMRKKARNADLDKKRLVRRALTAVVGTGAAGVTGFVLGSRTKAGQSTDWLGVDMEIWIGGIATGLGVLAQGKPRTAGAGEFLEAGGMGVLAYYAGSRGEQYGASNAVAA